MPVRDTPTTLLAHELRDTIGRLVRRLRAEPGPSVGRMAVLGRLSEAAELGIEAAPELQETALERRRSERA